jgi:hypothetical protein
MFECQNETIIIRSNNNNNIIIIMSQQKNTEFSTGSAHSMEARDSLVVCFGFFEVGF